MSAQVQNLANGLPKAIELPTFSVQVRVAHPMGEVIDEDDEDDEDDWPLCPEHKRDKLPKLVNPVWVDLLGQVVQPGGRTGEEDGVADQNRSRHTSEPEASAARFPPPGSPAPAAAVPSKRKALAALSANTAGVATQTAKKRKTPKK